MIDTETGQIKVEGPMQDEILFLGMLEMARVTFLEMRAANREGSGKRVIVPFPVLPKM